MPFKKSYRSNNGFPTTVFLLFFLPQLRDMSWIKNIEDGWHLTRGVERERKAIDDFTCSSMFNKPSTADRLGFCHVLLLLLLFAWIHRHRSKISKQSYEILSKTTFPHKQTKIRSRWAAAKPQPAIWDWLQPARRRWLQHRSKRYLPIRRIWLQQTSKNYQLPLPVSF